MFPFSLFRSHERPTLREFWSYFGSFGDDFFGDDIDDLEATASADH